jgi:anti-sigma B factor antagonist
MSEAAAKPVYFVDPYSDPVLVRIEGRANFQNGACLRDFITEMLRQGKKRFVIDFCHCTSMDSTFLGLLAGVALDLRKNGSPGSMALMRVGPRNLELVRNLGLHRLLTVEGGDLPVEGAKPVESLECPDRSELENARLALEAHENLVAADERNRSKFQDVLVFLKTRVEKR